MGGARGFELDTADCCWGRGGVCSCPTALRCLQLTGGAEATWQEVGSMPHKRIMADAVILCDGTIGIFNGAAEGIAVRPAAWRHALMLTGS